MASDLLELRRRVAEVLAREEWLPVIDHPETWGAMLGELARRRCWVHRVAILPRGCVVEVETPDGLDITERRATLGEALARALVRVVGGGE